MTRANHGHPAVSAQAGRVVVAVGQAGLVRGGNYPQRQHVPQLELLTHPALDGVTRDDAAKDVGRGGQIAPVAVGQLVDVFQKHRALPQQARAWLGRFVLGPFQAGVAHVKC